MLLQASDDVEQIRRRRIAFGTEHRMQRLHMNAGLLRGRGKAESRMDEVTQNLASAAPPRIAPAPATEQKKHQ
jgi:hypothetical protein